jgi:chromosome partitioning protein
MAKIYSIANQKGGVGKTTTCLNISTVLAEYGKRVLMVDLDPQAGLTTSLGYNPEELPKTSYDLIIRPEENKIDDVIKEVDNNLSFIPSNLDLSGVEAELIGEIGWDRTLKDILSLVSDRYDFIIIDCPPSLGVLTTNALMASKLVIVPVQAEYLAMRGLKQLQQIVTKVQKKGNPTLKIKILRTMHDSRTIHSTEIVEELKNIFGDQVFDAIIRRTIKFSESATAGIPIIKYAQDSAGAVAYRELTQEILNYEQKTTN